MRTVLAFSMLLVAFAASADILLDGHNHVGDCDDTTDINTGTPGLQTACDGFTPLDPVSRDNMFNTPYAFHLTTTTTIDKVRLENPISLDGKLQVYIQPLFGSPIFRTGSWGGISYDLVPDLVLAPGYYSVLPDGGCSNLGGSPSSYFHAGCSGTGDNDHGYSGVTLVSPQTSTSRHLIQRRHPGNPTDPANDNDQDDDYDFSDTGAPYYPDIAEGHPLDIPFTTDANRRLSEIRFYRARDVDNYTNTILIDGFAAGSIPNTGDPLEVNPSIISTNQLLLSGSHTLRVELGVISGADVDSFSWDSIILVFTEAAPTGSLGRFNAVDVGGAALNGVIRTKVSNQAFSLDLYAIDPLGAGVNTTYTGTVTVEVLDATDNTGPLDIYGCRTSWDNPVTLGSYTFVTADNGFKQITGLAYANALREARIRVTDTATGASGCSVDPLAIRPAGFDARASHANWASPGTATLLPDSGISATTTPIHKAGRNFTLRLRPEGAGGAPLPVTGYDGNPTLDVNSSVLGANPGTVSSGAWTVSSNVWRRDDVQYSEVGAVRLRAHDVDFASIDAADSTDSQRRIETVFDVGRFVPDHIAVVEADATPGCATFTYMGQAITYPTGAVTLVAENGNNTTTTNYTGTLSKLPASVAQASFTIYDDPGIAGTPTLNVPAGSHNIVDNADGTATIEVADFSVSRPLVPLAPFPAEIGIAFPSIAEGDGVALTESPIVLGLASALNGAPFTGGNNQVSYGRLFIQPTLGSERLSLAMPARIEIWDWTTFVPQVDACTQLQAADFTLTEVVGSSPAQTLTLNPAGPGPGPWAVNLSAPNVAGEATVSVDVDTVGPYIFLRDDADRDGSFDDDPSANASFGLYDRSDDNRVFQREVFR